MLNVSGLLQVNDQYQLISLIQLVSSKAYKTLTELGDEHIDRRHSCLIHLFVPQNDGAYSKYSTNATKLA